MLEHSEGDSVWLPARNCDVSPRATELSFVASISPDDARAISVDEHTRIVLRVWEFGKQGPACRSYLVSLLESRGRRVPSVRSTEPFANVVVQGGRRLA